MPHPSQKTRRSFLGLLAVLPLAAASLVAQAPAPEATPTRIVGTVTALASAAITVKTDKDGELNVAIPDGIKLQRVEPGAKDLSGATAIQFADLAVGDRVLIRVSSDSTPSALSAASLIAIAQSELAQKQQRDRMDWARRGVGGLVKSVDAASGTITITSGAGANQKTITLKTTPATVLRRYAADSVDFDKAQVAPIDTIKPGDQLRARGAKSADGTQLAAEEVVSGSFRNISGSIASINAQAGTITLKDLLTKQSVTVHIGPDAQMRKLPEQMARMLAASTKSSSSPSAAATPNAPASAPGAAASAPGGQPRSWNQAGGQSSGNGQPGGWAARAGGNDPQAMISRAPAIHLTDLQKGDAIMLVSTQGTGEVSAITLLAGVEPLLQSSAATQSLLLSSWSMSSGGAEAGAQ
jgi:hypothetical protein